MCFRTFSTVPLNSPIIVSVIATWMVIHVNPLPQGFRCARPTNLNLECDLYMNKATQKYFFLYFWSWHLGCIKVLTIGIAMRNLVYYDFAGPVPIGIPLRNVLNCKHAYMVDCAYSSWFAGNSIRLPIGTVTLKHSKSIKMMKLTFKTSLSVVHMHIIAP